ncbi:MAG: acetyl-CoA decarbonylase/synthase complex subunit alpha/beta [Candidatus Omnitrophica bacterium]|nr:acetyl-CoA decarbonylase/synthase complex subunit alpha/beta [Candidatus Omnitrophota bacterium]MDD5724686.1 acetyl-CoA decarbonylase/synthase complex subunit alpha/beta [Candidatus Omnitrophota bacterium]
MANNLPQIPGARKKGVVLITSEEDLGKLDSCLINDTVCVQGPFPVSLKFARIIRDKYKIPVKLVLEEGFPGEPPDDLQIIHTPVKEIIGEGRAEAVKFSDGKVAGVSLVVFIDKDIHNPPAEKTGEAGFPPEFTEAAERSSRVFLDLARRSLDDAVKLKGEETEVGFPGTNYCLPLVNALLGIEVKKLRDCREVLSQAEEISAARPASGESSSVNAPGPLNKGVSVLICQEILAALAVLSGEHPVEGCSGFIPDKVLRSLGLQLVDGRISGIALILGPAKDEESAVALIRDFQSKSIVSFLAGNIQGRSLGRQLRAQGVRLGLENYVVPLGEDYLSALYAVNFAVRAPLIYGGVALGRPEETAVYLRNRIPAFTLLLGHSDDALISFGLGGMFFGFPVVTDLKMPQVAKIETTLFEALVTEEDYLKIPSRCVMARQIKTRAADLRLPVPYAAAFEGERVSEEEMRVEFGGRGVPAVELLVSSLNGEEISGGNTELTGPDIDQLPEGENSLPLAVVVEVYGRLMQKDFEPILERQIHRFLNYAMGLTHSGQRDTLRIRISREAYLKGLRLKDLGGILQVMLCSEYGAIVDKVQVRIYTESEDVEEVLSRAKEVYRQRDGRLSGMTDEGVDDFYSCLLCQSFAPNHVCVLTPERPGLCGAYSWLDAKASSEIIPTGPNQPIAKGNLLDLRRGQWDNLNEFVRQKSNRSIDSVSIYSLTDHPQSSCGCFECVVALIPEANGVMVVDRDYAGVTPLGMDFTALAGLVGRGVQTPGFMGIGKAYILSRKFILAEGGLPRVVWMPRQLKELLREGFKRRAEEAGYPDLWDKIADENSAVGLEELLDFLKRVNHPALAMDRIL